METTIVTCFYKIISKHSYEMYIKWLSNLLNNIRCNIIIFTSKDQEKIIKNEIHNAKYFFIIKNIEEFNISKKYNNDFWINQYKLDTQKNSGRTISCYKIWNSKFDMLKEAIEINPFKSDKFIWNDIGNMRNINNINLLKNYPVFHKISDNKLDIILLNNFKNENQIFFNNEIHFSGSIFGGHKDLILELHKLYYIYFELYVTNNKFIGCDQQIISTIYLKNKNMFNCVYPKNDVIDPWFYLYKHYS